MQCVEILPVMFQIIFLLFLTDFFPPRLHPLSPTFGDNLYVIWAADHFPSCSHKHIMVKELHLFPMQHYFLLRQKHFLVSVSLRKKTTVQCVDLKQRRRNTLIFNTFQASAVRMRDIQMMLLLCSSCCLEREKERCCL